MSDRADLYRARFRRVLEHIDANPDADLSADALSRLAACSKYHFHRQFSLLFGLSVRHYVELSRLKRAAYRLAFRQDQSITAIALDSGYRDPESFSRAFRRRLGQSPSDFRKAPRWRHWLAVYHPLRQFRRQFMQTPPDAIQVIVKTVEPIPVAVLEHRGDPALTGESVRRFIAWRREAKLPPGRSATFNLFYDDPARTPAEDYRLDLCAATDAEIAANAYGVVAKTIPGGRVAVLRHIGSDDTLEASVAYLYSQWLPQSGEELRDFPLYCQRVKFFPEVAETEAVIDVFLPLK